MSKELTPLPPRFDDDLLVFKNEDGDVVHTFKNEDGEVAAMLKRQDYEVMQRKVIFLKKVIAKHNLQDEYNMLRFENWVLNNFPVVKEQLAIYSNNKEALKEIEEGKQNIPITGIQLQSHRIDNVLDWLEDLNNRLKKIENFTNKG